MDTHPIPLEDRRNKVIVPRPPDAPLDLDLSRIRKTDTFATKVLSWIFVSPVRPHGLHTLVSQLVKKSGREASQELHIALSQRIVAKHLHMPGISIEATADEIRHLAEKAERKAESVGDRVADASSAGTRDKADHRAAGRAHEEVASLSKPTKVRLSWITRPVWRTA